MISRDIRTPFWAPDPARIPWFLALATLIIYLLWRGYTYGNGDHDDFLPYLLHLLDPRILAPDWLVSTQTSGIGPRTGFVWLTYLPAKLIGAPATYALLYIPCWFFIAGALYKISYHITPDRIAATGTVVAVLLLTPKFTLGSNDIILRQFTPSVLGWALALWGIVMYLRGRSLASGVLLGIAACVQALIGLQTALLVGVLMVWDRRSLRAILAYSLVFALIAMVTVAPQVIQQWNASTTTPSLFHVLFEFRAPHHYIPTRFVSISASGFAFLVVAGLFSFSALDKTQRTLPLRALAIIGVLCLLSFIGTEVLRSEFVGKLQIFKTTVLAKVMLVTVICAAINRLLPQFVRRALTPFYNHAHYSFIGVALVALAMFVASPDALGFRTTSETTQEQVAQWAHAEAPLEAVFAVPPSWEGFRSQAQRSIVVNFKAVPFVADNTIRWYERLLTMAPIEAPQEERSMQDLIRQLDDAFFALSVQEIGQLSQRFGFDYVVRRGPFEIAPTGFEEVFATHGMVVYHISNL